MSDETQAETPEGKPVLRVVKGDPTAEELAALVAVVAARNAAAAAAAADSKPKPRSQWGHPTRQHRTPHRFGPGQWRASAL
ncbi:MULTISPECIES: acyl-CoA carboxylase subunit epsilon [unclassified Aeromicrobium]|uniref:acyl-CoA carboxylase subunit epsilon n=1 Tax=unclassified Aeromicrobium TaxID=2633570 RepID=UPI00396B0A12